MAFQVKCIDHVEIFVRDIDASERWYRETLGLRRGVSWSPEPVMIGRGGTKLALFRAPRGSRPLDTRAHRASTRCVSIHRVAFLTDRRGFDMVQKRLSARAIAFRGPIDHGATRSIYFHDPDGILLEITHPVRGGRPR
ncbi:MAG: VOC family protein [bacterium]